MSRVMIASHLEPRPSLTFHISCSRRSLGGEFSCSTSLESPPGDRGTPPGPPTQRCSAHRRERSQRTELVILLRAFLSHNNSLYKLQGNLNVLEKLNWIFLTFQIYYLWNSWIWLSFVSRKLQSIIDYKSEQNKHLPHYSKLFIRDQDSTKFTTWRIYWEYFYKHE